MATKKGIALTGIILAAITAASFLIWLIPQNVETKFVISDFEANLDAVKEIHSTLQTNIEKEFQDMLDEKISTEEYIQTAEISSTQVNSQIIQLVESKAPQEWYDSYLNYIEALKKFNSQIRESVVVASMINDNRDKVEIQNALEKIDLLQKESELLITSSDESRP